MQNIEANLLFFPSYMYSSDTVSVFSPSVMVNVSESAESVILSLLSLSASKSVCIRVCLSICPLIYARFATRDSVVVVVGLIQNFTSLQIRQKIFNFFLINKKNIFIVNFFYLNPQQMVPLPLSVFFFFQYENLQMGDGAG